MSDLEMFARFVLTHMEATPEWDADMTDEIATEAIRLGLADTAPPDHYFRHKLEGVPHVDFA